MKLNIGCGYDKRPGFINIDKNPKVNPDKVVDIEKGIPFPDNKFEHVINLDFVMEELYRVMTSVSILIVEVPYYNAKVAYTNPDHKRFFTEQTFQYYENLFTVRKVEKQRGRIIPWHVHGLRFVLCKNYTEVF